MNHNEFQTIARNAKDLAARINAEIAVASNDDEKARLEGALDKVKNAKAIGGCNCPVCGRPVEVFVCKAGKKKQVHNECREFQATLARLQTLAEKVHFADSDEGRARLKMYRGQIWSLLNTNLHFNTAKFANASDSDDKSERKGTDTADASFVATNIDEASAFFAAIEDEAFPAVEAVVEAPAAVEAVEVVVEAPAAVEAVEVVVEAPAAVEAVEVVVEAPAAVEAVVEAPAEKKNTKRVHTVKVKGGRISKRASASTYTHVIVCDADDNGRGAFSWHKTAAAAEKRAKTVRGLHGISNVAVVALDENGNGAE